LATIIYTLKQVDGSNLPNPPFTSFDPNPNSLSLTIYSNDLTLQANYSLVLKIQDTVTLNSSDTIRFDVTVHCIQTLVPDSVISQILYIINPSAPTP